MATHHITTTTEIVEVKTKKLHRVKFENFNDTICCGAIPIRVSYFCRVF